MLCSGFFKTTLRTTHNQAHQATVCLIQRLVLGGTGYELCVGDAAAMASPLRWQTAETLVSVTPCNQPRVSVATNKCPLGNSMSNNRDRCWHAVLPVWVTEHVRLRCRFICSIFVRGIKSNAIMLITLIEGFIIAFFSSLPFPPSLLFLKPLPGLSSLLFTACGDGGAGAACWWHVLITSVSLCALLILSGGGENCSVESHND